MSVVGKVVNGRPWGVRCDMCGRITRDSGGGYFDKATNRGGTISSKGRECKHDVCSHCQEGISGDACPKCGALPPPREPRAREPFREVCLAHLEEEPCQTCAAYIAAGL